MNEYIARQTQAFLTDVANTKVPAEVQAIAQDCVAKAHEAFAQWRDATHSGTRAIDEVMLANRSGAKAIVDKIFSNAEASAGAAFEAAQGFARAETLSELVRQQAKFVQEQLAIASQQGNALLELSAKIAQETTDTLSAIGKKSAGDLQKAGQ